MKTLLIFNAKSGRAGRNARLEPLLRQFVNGSRGTAELALTAGPGHATVLASEAVVRGFDRVIAVGGDGTLNETAQALLHQPVSLGLVPCGSGNGLARQLRLPLAPLAALRLIGDPQTPTRLIDTGLAAGHPFFNVMGLGLDAEIAQRFNALRTRGLPTYVRAAWQAFLTRVAEPCVISDSHHREAVPVFMLTVANSEQYGNEARIAPGAQLDDGLLDLVAVRPLGLFGAIGFAGRLFAGNVLRAPSVRHWRSAQFQVERSAPGLIHTDGETHAVGATVTISVAPLSLRVLAPAVSGRAAEARAFALQL